MRAMRWWFNATKADDITCTAAMNGASTIRQASLPRVTLTSRSSANLFSRVFACRNHKAFAGIIRKKYPRTANFAVAGNRPLSQLGGFREYVEPMRPRVVLWAVNPNFAVTDEETRDPMLARYLDPTYSQHLLAQQRDIDRLVRTIAIPAQVELDRQAQTKERRARVARFERAWLLPETREQVGRLIGDERIGWQRTRPVRNLCKVCSLPSTLASAGAGR